MRVYPGLLWLVYFSYSKKGRGAEVDEGIPSSTCQLVYFGSSTLVGAELKNEVPKKRYDYTLPLKGTHLSKTLIPRSTNWKKGPTQKWTIQNLRKQKKLKTNWFFRTLKWKF